MVYEGWKTHKHSPPHLLLDNTWYHVSASAWQRLKWFQDEYLAEALALVLQEEYARFGWNVEFYVIMPDHYHCIAISSQGGDLPGICKRVHGRMSSLMRNRLRVLGSIGSITSSPKQFFYNYWDSCLNTEKEYYEALEYVRTNPIRAGLARVAQEYKFWGPRKDERLQVG